MRLGSANARVLVALVLGIAVGLAVPAPSLQWLQPLGTLFVDLLRTIMLPIVVAMFVSAVASLPREGLLRVGRRLILWCAAAGLLASVLGVLLAAVIRPGAGLALPPSALGPAPEATPGLLRTLVPGNLAAAAAEGNVLGILFFTALFGLALNGLRESRSPEVQRAAGVVVDLARAGSEALTVVLRWIMLYAPVGVFALTALTFANAGLAALVSFLKVHLAIDLGMLILCALGVVLLRRRGVGAVAFVRAIETPLVTAFSTQSSAATLPAELASARKELGLPPGVAGLAIPVAVSLMKVGSAIFIGVLAVFAADVGGIALTPSVLALIVATTFAASVATAPVSGGAMVQLTAVFQQAGLPLGAIPLVAGIPFAGKLNTAMNVAGHLVLATLLAEKEKGERAGSVAEARPA